MYFKVIMFVGLAPQEETNLRYLEEVAIKIAGDIVDGKIKIDRTQKSLVDKVTAFALDFEFVREKVFGKAKAQVLKMSGGLYPAPLKVGLFQHIHYSFRSIHVK